MNECINQTYVINGQHGTSVKSAAPRAMTGISAVTLRLLATLSAWQERANSRRELLRLDSRALNDIGISRADAEHEADKPFWRR